MPTTEAFRGGVSVTGLTAGDTSLTIQAGTVSKTIPVHVLANLIPDFPEGTSNGVTWTKTGSGWHAKGTATAFSAREVPVTLEAGTYEIGGLDTTVSGIKITRKNETTSLLDTRTTAKAQLPAGDYTASLFVLAGKTVDIDLHPWLTRVDA